MLRKFYLSLILLIPLIFVIPVSGQDNGNGNGVSTSPKAPPTVVLDDGSGQTPIAKGLTKHTKHLRCRARHSDDPDVVKNCEDPVTGDTYDQSAPKSGPHSTCQDPTSNDTWEKNNQDSRNGNKNSKLQKAQNCNVAALDVVAAEDPADPAKCHKNADDKTPCGISDVTVSVPDPNSPGATTTKKVGKQMKNVVTVYYDNPTERSDDNGAVAHDKNNNPIQPPLRMGPKRNNSQSIEMPTNFTDPNNPDPMNASFVADPNNPVPKPNVSYFHDNMGISPAQFAYNCFKAGGTPQPTALTPVCDLNNAAVARANAAWKNRPNPQPGEPDNLFDVDDYGNPTDSSVEKSNGALHWGEEARQQTITETQSIHCPDGFDFVDDSATTQTAGHCEKPDPLGAAIAAAGFQPFSALTGGVTSADKYAMMGFTFAPPEVSWSWSTDESACFWGFCVTLFAADVGYDFDIGAGLRLPVQVHFPDVPVGPLATNTASLNPTLTPVNFMQQDYKDFCNDSSQNPGMVDGFIISSCDRFSFPEYFSKTVHDEQVGHVPTPVPVDGKELVAQAIISAWANVTVMDVKILDINLTAGSDYSTDLTALNLMSNGLAGQLHSFPTGNLDADQDFLNTINSQALNLSSFTPPFGLDADGKQRMLTGTFHFDADCTKADLEGLYIGKDKTDICTGLKVNYYGATLGVGLTVILGAGSSEIKTDWSAAGDAIPASPMTAEFHSYSNPEIGPITFDDYDANTDFATVKLDDFTFCVNIFSVELDANLEFGGILSPIPSLPSFPIFKINYSPSGCGIPIGQHNRTGPVHFTIPVTNYALSISGAPSVPSGDPNYVDAKTLKIKPGKPGTFPGSFNITAKNEGTASDTVKNFVAELPLDTPAVADLPTQWVASWDSSSPSLSCNNGHADCSGSVALSVNPPRNPLTKPSPPTYPVKVTADSSNAVANNLPSTDPIGKHRTDAPDTVNVYVLPFSQPHLTVVPSSSSGKPGPPAQSYAVTGQNYGNDKDYFGLNLAFVDFNVAGCSLTTLGSIPGPNGCPYRAFPTIIQDSWTNGTKLAFPANFPVQPTSPPPAYLNPLDAANATLSIGVPSDWAGMQDTTYTWTLTATSQNGADSPPGAAIISVPQTVRATKLTMVRYIGLEITEFIARVQAADAAGYNTAGILPLLMHPIQRENDDAIAYTLAGDFTNASKDLATEINQVQAIQNMLKNMNVPSGTLLDWQARCVALINDITLAQANNTN